MSDFIESDIKLTIGILVSNQIKYIRKAMESIKPLLDSVSSELIVVDTVGEENSDGSLAIAKEYTDKIYHFEWNDDFSAARNVTFEYARGEWYMFFDDDEVFDDVTELIRFFNSDECKKYNYGQFYVANYTDDEHYQKDIVARLIRRTKKTRFVGIIHECFNEAYLPLKQFNVFLHHYGYLFATREQMEKKNKRNLRLLEKEYERDGASVRLCMHIVQQLMVPNPGEAERRCDEFLKLYEGSEDLENPIGQWLIVSKLRIKVILGKLDEILACEKELLDKYKLNETARLVIAHRTAFAAARERSYEIASERAKEYFSLLKWLDENEKDKSIQAVVDLASFMTGERLFIMTEIGAVSEYEQRHFDEAYAYVKRFDYKYCRDYDEIREVVETTLKGLKDKKPLIEFYKRFYKDEFFSEPGLKKYLPEDIRIRL